MASVPGSHYDVYAGSRSVNIGMTADPNNVPTPVAGDFNLEIVTTATGTGSFATAPGYQALAILSSDGETFTALHGDYNATDAGGNHLISLGDGNMSVTGAAGDSILGGTGSSDIDGSLGKQSIVGGSGSRETIWGGAGDTIRGSDAGNSLIDGWCGGQTIIGGNGGNETIVGSTGGRAAPPSNPMDTNWNIVATGDFNGDGKADLVWERPSDHMAEVQLFDGSMPSGGGAIDNNPFDASWVPVAAGDFNGDGKSDLVYRRVSDGYTEIQLLNGTQAVGGGAIANNPFDSSWQIVATGDFNGDGKADLVWRHNSDGMTEVQYLSGNTAVGGGIIANNPFDTSWSVVAHGDFNGDGKADLVWRHNSDGLIEIQYLSGNTAVGGGIIENNPFDASWNVVGTGDFLGNGQADLVWQRASDGLVEIQYLNGNVAVGGGAIQNTSFGADWQVAGVDDFNGDGKADLVYRRASDGATEVQLLSGTSVIGGGAPPGNAGDLIHGGTGGNETIYGSVNDTVIGGSGGNETIFGAAGGTIMGGAANTFIDASAGSASILAGSGNSTIMGGASDTVQGASVGGSAMIGFSGGNETLVDNGGGIDSITGFSQANGDLVSLNGATDAVDNVLATASTQDGNTIVTLHDGSTITFVGVTNIDSGLFRTH